MRYKLLLLGMALAFSLLLWGGSSVADSELPTIVTFAGKGVGQGGPATSASLDHPWSVSVDSSGNLYIADKDNCLVHKVDSVSGVLTTIAGNGFQGYSGDGGPATSARLYDPAGTAVDAAGNLYFADTTNHRVRKVDTSGVITTVAGSATACGSLGDGGPATSASLCGPKGVALDAAGNLYIADTFNQRIRMVDSGGVISTVAGNGTPGDSGDGAPATSASLRYPAGVALDAADNLYIADTANHRVRKVDSSGDIDTVAGDGSPGFSGDGDPATGASLYYPSGLSVDAAGDLYIADTSNHRVREVDTSGDIDTVAGNGSPGYSGDGGPATSASLDFPSSVSVDAAGNLYIADFWGDRIRKVDVAGDISTVVGSGRQRYSGDGGPAIDAGLSLPADVAADAAGNLYIADYANNRIRRVNTGGVISTVAGNGMPGYSGDGDTATSASLYYPSGIAVGPSGDLYIADSANNRVRKVNGAGIISTVAGNGTAGYGGEGGPATSAELDLPWDVAVDAAGNLYIADYNNQRVREVDVSGNITTVAGNGTADYGGDGGPATSAALCGPSGLALDSTGNLYIAESCNNRVRMVDTAGIITTFAGDGVAGYSGDDGPATGAHLNNPHGLALDAAGNLCIGDSANHRVRKVDSEGTITTFAGNGAAGFSGDGGSAASAGINRPRGVAIDARGNLFVADQGNNRVREVVAAASPAPVGGIAGPPSTGGEGLSDRGGSSAPGAPALAGLAVGGALLLVAGGWYVRRRRQAG